MSGPLIRDLPDVELTGALATLKPWVAAVKESLQVGSGQRAQAADSAWVRRNELVDFGLLTRRRGAGGGYALPNGGLGYEPLYVPDPTPPPTPTGLEVTAGLSYLYIEHDTPDYLMGHGHDRTIVYGRKWPVGDPLPTFSDAVQLFDFQGTIGAYPTEPATRWRIWIKWQTRDGVQSTNPAGGTNGALVTTGQDVSLLLAALTGQIRESQLYASLGTRIDLIDGAASMSGSVNQRIVQGDSANAALITTVQAVSGAANPNSVANPGFVAGGGGWDVGQLFDSTVGGCPANSPSPRVLRSNQRDTINSALVKVAPGEVIDFSAWLASVTPTNVSCNILLQCFRRDGSVHDVYNYPSIAAQPPGLTSWRQIFGTWTVPDASVDVGFYRLDLQVDQLSSGGANVVWWSQPAAVKRSGTGSALAASVQIEASARASADGQLFAQYTVKLDVNGYVSGFGLASTGGTAAPSSNFIIRSDSFAVASPTGPGITPIVPFIVRTTPGVINGVAYPSGVYIDAAYILDLTAAIARLGVAWIDDAKIATLSAAKLNVGDGTVGGNLRSTVYTPGSAGWIVRPDGYAEFNTVVVRGTIMSGAGLIGGITIGLGDLRSTNYINGSAGFRINADGSAEFYNVTARGNIAASSITVGSAPALSGGTMTGAGAVVNSNGTFAFGNTAGNITFDGATIRLNGAVVAAANVQNSAVGTIAIAPGAVNVPIPGSVTGVARSTTVVGSRTTSRTIGSITTAANGAGNVTLFLSPNGISANPSWWIYSYILAECSTTDIGGTFICTFSIKRNGATIWTQSTSNGTSGSGTSTRFMHAPIIIDSPGAGVACTYTLEIYSETTAGVSNHAHEIIPFSFVLTDTKR